MINFSDLTERLRKICFNDDDLKLYLVGDIHSSSHWKKHYDAYLRDPNKNKRFIFFGDLVDKKKDEMLNRKTENRTAQDIFDEIYASKIDPITLKTILDVQRVLLRDTNSYMIIGNHDVMSYIDLNYKCSPDNPYKELENLKNNPDYVKASSKIIEAYHTIFTKSINKPTFYLEFSNWILAHNGLSNDRFDKVKNIRIRYNPDWFVENGEFLHEILYKKPKSEPEGYFYFGKNQVMGHQSIKRLGNGKFPVIFNL